MAPWLEYLVPRWLGWFGKSAEEPPSPCEFCAPELCVFAQGTWTEICDETELERKGY